MSSMQPLSVLDKYSLGVGDRFAHQGRAQLRACVQAAKLGVTVVPVWNKSNREQMIVGSQPVSVREEADEAVRALGWTSPYYVDADHINLETVDRFIEWSDFFTLDVAGAIGQAPERSVIDDFLRAHPELTGTIAIDGIAQPFHVSRAQAVEIATKYLHAVREAGAIYHRVATAKGHAGFVTEV
jgi:tagaturonate epimerase